MRPDLDVTRQLWGGETLWVIKDPVSLEYFQLPEEEYAILTMLDGRTSPQQIQQRFARRFAPQQLTPLRLWSFLGELHESGLVVSDGVRQGEQLLERRRHRRRQALVHALGNVLAIRFRGVDPEPLLRRLYPAVRWMFSPWFFAGWLLLAASALLLTAVQFETLTARLPGFRDFFSTGNLLWLAAALAAVKVLHELGHALACRHFGGECHEIGLMLLAFTPCLYCNVSDSWRLPGKWRRAAVSAAGMYVEILLASVCTFLWWFSRPGLLNSLCLDVMFVCSVSAVVFNGNPLMRYDGYYILADLLEVPNLWTQSRLVLKRTLLRWTLGVETDERRLPPRRRLLLAGYAVLSMAYRVAVVAAILWLLHEWLEPYRLEMIARMLAVVIFGGMLAAPLTGLVRFARERRHWTSVRPHRAVLTGFVIAGFAAIVLFVPLPRRVRAPAALRPVDARTVYVSVPGRLVEAVPAGTQVRAGETLAVLSNPHIDLELEQLAGERNRQAARLKHLTALRAIDPAAGAEIPAARNALADLEERLAQKRQDRQELVLTAPLAGTVIPPHSVPDAVGVRDASPDELPTWSGTPLEPRNVGCWLETGTMLCLLGDPHRLEAVVTVDQTDIEFVRIGQPVRIDLDGVPGARLEGTVAEIGVSTPTGSSVERRGSRAAPLALDPGPSTLDQPAARQSSPAGYQVRVRLDPVSIPNAGAPLIGAAGRARITVRPQSLGRRLLRYVQRTFRFEL